MKFKVSIIVGVVEANSQEEANKKAIQHLENFAGSNDGSEILANAEPILTETTTNASWSKWGGFKN
jgi:hypothetical protein